MKLLARYIGDERNGRPGPPGPAVLGHGPGRVTVPARLEIAAGGAFPGQGEPNLDSTNKARWSSTSGLTMTSWYLLPPGRGSPPTFSRLMMASRTSQSRLCPGLSTRQAQRVQRRLSAVGREGNVVVAFGTPVNWVLMTPDGTRKLLAGNRAEAGADTPADSACILRTYGRQGRDILDAVVA